MCLTVDEIIAQINHLLDQQLSFLTSNLGGMDSAGFEEYELRYDAIRRLCGQLERWPPQETEAHSVGA